MHSKGTPATSGPDHFVFPSPGLPACLGRDGGLAWGLSAVDPPLISYELRIAYEIQPGTKQSKEKRKKPDRPGWLPLFIKRRNSASK
jgi:hypothetical protein